MIFFIDVQGTLIDDKYKKPIEGAIEFIDRLNKKDIAYIVITNNTKDYSQDFIYFLNKIGLDIDEKNYIDPLMVLKDILKTKRVAAYGVEKFLEIVKSLGYVLDFKNPETVLVSVKKDYNNEDFAQMIEFLLKGAGLYGMHAISIYAKDSKRYPGVGAILEMLKFATNKDYEVAGKPSVNFYKKALSKLRNISNKEFSFKDITIISDDAKGDLVGAKRLGMKTVLVLSGKIKDEKEIIPFLEDDEKPDLIFKDIGEAGRKLGVI
ncbi:HAD-IIA family hydrolase [Nitrosophilus labii]|uniref:HAD-IIA family hydrolase n=1 Tax=Nitrosophilus labii TaxID=2706014 RepID=UPI0018D97827|nr:HAD-IIA family hydrolase [Nitrosophilus labii]